MEEKIKVIYENKNYAIISKKSGIIVNKSDTTKNEITLQDIVDKTGLIDEDDPSDEFKNRSGIVHRLDRETSGIMIIAKNSNTFFAIQMQFKERNVEKSYLALSHGDIIPKKGEINVRVGRLPWNRKRFGVISGGRESLTKYLVLKTYQIKDYEEVLSLVRLFPKTGRTHQIRVHLKHIGYPIFSDQLYGGRKIARNDRKLLERVFLHAEKISFNDPTTGDRVEYEAKLPIELKSFLDSLREVGK